jgi:hypothetical protein
MKFSDKILLSYVNERTKEFPLFYNFVRKSYLFSLVIIAPFIVFGLAKPKGKTLVSGNRNSKFFYSSSASVSYQFWGVALFNKNIGVNIAKMYLATFLYCFCSRKFAFFYRKTIIQYRDRIRGAGLEVVFTHSDALPVARAMIHCLKPLGIKFICVQHGVFHSELKNEIDGIKCDLNIVMNPTQLKLFLNSNSINNIVYSDLVSNRIEIYCEKTKEFDSVVLIGEGLHSISKTKNDELLRAYDLVKERCSFHNVKCLYKPHPSEKRKGTLWLQLLMRYKRFLVTDDLDGKLYVGVHSSHMQKIFESGGGVVRLNLNSLDDSLSPFNQIPNLTLGGMDMLLKDKCFSQYPTTNTLSFFSRYDINIILKCYYSLQ